MVKAQEWLDKNYPDEKRNKITRLDISNNSLEGELKLNGFVNLVKLNCSGNSIIKLSFDSSYNEKKLIKLDISDNDFNEQDLSCFGSFTKLKKLYLGTTNKIRIKKRVCNRFYGSLEPLKTLTELKELGISNTNIDRGLEHLPDSLEKLYCVNHWDDAGCKKIMKELGIYFNKGEQYYDLQNWRRARRVVATEKFFPLTRPLLPITLNKTTTKAQKWLDKEYPTKEKRANCIALNISPSEIGKILEGSLDLKDFESLRILNCPEQQITKIEFGNHQELEELYCDKNQLTSLEIKNCPDLTKIDCSKNLLKSLVVSGCPKLSELYCSNNCLTNFDFNVLDKKSLTRLDLKNNSLSRRDLSVLSSFTNLEMIDIGSNNQEKINKGMYNRFRGSLESLKNMDKLKSLNIEATDIKEGLEYLPDEKLRGFYCTSHRTVTKVNSIEEELGKYAIQGSKALPIAFSGNEEGKISSFNPLNYFDNLQRWREDNYDLIQRVKQEQQMAQVQVNN